MFYFINNSEGFLTNLAIVSVVCVFQHEVFVQSLFRELRSGSDLSIHDGPSSYGSRLPDPQLAGFDRLSGWKAA